MLCYAFLLVSSAADDKEALAWADRVLSTAAVCSEPGSEPSVPTDPWWQRRGKQCALAYEPLRVAMTAIAWHDFELDRVGAAMQRWRGDGRCDGLGSYELRRQTRTDAARRLKGPKDSKGNAGPRYEHAIIEVANLVKKHSKLLLKEGKRDGPAGPTMLEEIAQLKKEAEKKEAGLEAARLSARREGDAKRQLKSRLIAKKSAVSEARKEEKAKAKAKAKEVKAQQDKEVRKRIGAAVERLVERRAAQEQLSQEQRIDELTRQVAKGRRRARDKESDAKLSKKRLSRAKVI